MRDTAFMNKDKKEWTTGWRDLILPWHAREANTFSTVSGRVPWTLPAEQSSWSRKRVEMRPVSMIKNTARWHKTQVLRQTNLNLLSKILLLCFRRQIKAKLVNNLNADTYKICFLILKCANVPQQWPWRRRVDPVGSRSSPSPWSTPEPSPPEPVDRLPAAASPPGLNFASVADKTCRKRNPESVTCAQTAVMPVWLVNWSISDLNFSS